MSDLPTKTGSIQNNGKAVPVRNRPISGVSPTGVPIWDLADTICPRIGRSHRLTGPPVPSIFNLRGNVQRVFRCSTCFDRFPTQIGESCAHRKWSAFAQPQDHPTGPCGSALLPIPLQDRSRHCVLPVTASLPLTEGLVKAQWLIPQRISRISTYRRTPHFETWIVWVQQRFSLE